MGAGNEHHQPESNLGQEGERGIGGVQVTHPCRAQDDPDRELTDDNRHVPASGVSQDRPDQAGQDNDAQHGEVHWHLLFGDVSGRGGRW